MQFRSSVDGIAKIHFQS